MESNVYIEMIWSLWLYIVKKKVQGYARSDVKEDARIANV